MKHKMLRIEPRLAFINGVLLAKQVLIFRFQLLAVYVLLVHNCGECRIVLTSILEVFILVFVIKFVTIALKKKLRHIYT
jgi:hypothetical protein